MYNYTNSSANPLNELVALFNQGKFGQVVQKGESLARLYPKAVVILNLLGASHAQMGNVDAALEKFEKSRKLDRNNLDTLNNIANCLKLLQRHDEAIAIYRKCLDANRNNHVAWNNLGACYNALYRQAEAVEAYRKSIAINAGYAPAWNNLGNVLLDLGQPEQAIAAYQRTLAINPSHADAHSHMGNALKELGRLDEAIASYARALEFKPDHVVAEGMMLHQMQHICDWSRHEQMLSRCAVLGVETAGITPFAGLSMEDHPQRQLVRAQKYAAEQFKIPPAPLKTGRTAHRQRIRIGYFSADFHENHPVMQLFTGVARNHDRASFELFGYDFSGKPEPGSKDAFKACFDVYTDVRNTDTDALVALARSHELDIAVDLNGYTAQNRVHWFQRRLAPLQVNFLGYPGTMGADFLDYIVADPVVIPDEQRAFYSENLIWLPHCYLPNDDQREIASAATSRADFDLPEDAVVFCCFNLPYKISPREFGIWMRVLGKVDGSVLWLSRSNQWAIANLRKEAAARGIDPDRLVLAGRVPENADHLARLKHADLFLDTFAYNAHATACDALWAGLPVVTKQGKQFAARVAASALTAAGLPELITSTDDEYEALILDLAMDRGKLAAITAKLAANRKTCPLFDTALFTRNLEDGFRQAYQRLLDGQLPADIRV